MGNRELIEEILVYKSRWDAVREESCISAHELQALVKTDDGLNAELRVALEAVLNYYKTLEKRKRQIVKTLLDELEALDLEYELASIISPGRMYRKLEENVGRLDVLEQRIHRMGLWMGVEENVPGKAEKWRGWGRQKSKDKSILKDVIKEDIKRAKNHARINVGNTKSIEALAEDQVLIAGVEAELSYQRIYQIGESSIMRKPRIVADAESWHREYISIKEHRISEQEIETMAALCHEGGMKLQEAFKAARALEKD